MEEGFLLPGMLCPAIALGSKASLVGLLLFRSSVTGSGIEVPLDVPCTLSSVSSKQIKRDIL